MSDSYEFGPFRLEPGERTLVHDGEFLVLAPKSFDLLCVLVQNSGKLLDKDFLLNTVWPDVTVEENSLAKAITEIRRVLGERPRENRYIATVARRGYRFLADVTVPSSEPSARTSLTTLAVLPFTWLTQEGSDSGLALGMADAVITRISNLPQLIVRPTTSILKYISGAVNPVEIGAELRVDYAITGSLRQAGDRVCVTVQMVSPREQRVVWADRFEEERRHIFAVEDAISERVAAALALKLTRSQKQALSRRCTENCEAYQLYLRGRYFWSKQTATGAQKAMSCFRQAIDLDPGFELAWVGLSDTFILIGLSGALTSGLPPHHIYPEARRAALKAIELDPELSQGHAALGFVRFFYDWDLAGARQSLNRAMFLRPQCAGSHHGFALSSGFLGRHQDGLAQIQRALEIDPLSPILNANKGYLLYLARRYEESAVLLRSTLEIEPSFAATHYRLTLTYAAQGLQARAILHFQEAQRCSGESPETLGALGYLYARTGDRAAASEILQRLEDAGKSRYVSPVIPAEVYLGLGDFPSALSWLGRALDDRSGALLRFRVEPRFDAVRDDPRVQELLARMDALPATEISNAGD